MNLGPKFGRCGRVNRGRNCAEVVSGIRANRLPNIKAARMEIWILGIALGSKQTRGGRVGIVYVLKFEDPPPWTLVDVVFGGEMAGLSTKF